MKHSFCGANVVQLYKKKIASRLLLTCDSSSYSKRDLNPHSHYWPKDFKSFVSTIPPFEHPQ